MGPGIVEHAVDNVAQGFGKARDVAVASALGAGLGGLRFRCVPHIGRFGLVQGIHSNVFCF